MDDQLVMVSYLKSGRCWHILRVFNDNTFDIFYSCTQPVHDAEVRRQRYKFAEFDNVIRVGELKDWIGGVIGIN